MAKPQANQSAKPRIRTFARVAALAAGALITLGSPGASAQTDINPPLPNVLLLVDTSGSMEYKTGAASFPTCRYSDGSDKGGTSERSRWIDLLEVLTGSISNYECEKLSRKTAAFRDEYKFLKSEPYDFQYSNPYHRPLSGTCAPGPGYIPAGQPYAFSTDDPSTGLWEGAIKYHPYNSPGSTCTFNQTADGILDTYANGFRFGLMTFDSETRSDSNEDGLYSYYVGSPRTGRPLGCLTDQPQEVGARNAAAPPWEGRLVAFGNPAPGNSEFLSKNSQIQEILRAVRPYGATPIAGMLHDARDFLWSDKTKDPLNSTQDFGPYADPYVAGGCRKQVVLLLSDGLPNMDLRPHCEPNHCPYEKPELIARDLRAPVDPARRPVPTYVIGFALSSLTVEGKAVDCTALSEDDFNDGNPSSLCSKAADNPGLRACCTLNRIAAEGGLKRKRALFANDREGLRNAINAVLSENYEVTSRTQPVVAASGASDAAASYRFLTGFKALPFEPWSAEIQRQRISCNAKGEPVENTIDPSKGDDFVANVNSGKGRVRRFYSVLGNGPTIYSERTIRPHLTSGDVFTSYTGTQYGGVAASFVSATTPSAMGCTDVSTAAACRDKYLKWLVGLDNGTENHRCKTPGTETCTLVGDILHSTPRVVGRPAEYVRDESYIAYQNAQSKRPVVLYTSTNDGFLHAFKVGPNDATDAEKVQSQENNELWAFLPPALLPHIASQYPSTHQLLLDGVPVIKDVVATKTTSSYGYKLERTAADARAAAGTWRTILVQSFGSLRGGYFALDVTDPVPSDTDSTKGPKFLWQLTTDADGNPLFGEKGGVPAITTLYVGGKEVAVAILPGGGSTPAVGGTGCDRVSTGPYSLVDSNFVPRSKVRCYSNVRSRSLTIVRLDTGEILRTFRRAATELADAQQTLVTIAKLDSPLSGEPVVFPANVGAVSDRVFIGDQDGTIWKVDLSKTDPKDWSMDLFFDTYPASLGHTWESGQTIATPPILSVDDRGNLTLNVSTGDQEAVGAAPNMKNYVWSLTERADAARTKLEAIVNWYLGFDGGERVTGPMSLFNTGLYFTSYQPPSATAGVCDDGTSRVWGMHYINPKDKNQLELGGGAVLRAVDDEAAFVQYYTTEDVTNSPSAVIFGVTVAQQPSCVSGTNNTSNDFLGYGVHKSLSGVNPGKFQLLMHTGRTQASGSNGTLKVSSPEGSSVNAVAVDLENPPNSSRIDSWAAIVE